MQDVGRYQASVKSFRGPQDPRFEDGVEYCKTKKIILYAQYNARIRLIALSISHNLL